MVFVVWKPWQPRRGIPSGKSGKSLKRRFFENGYRHRVCPVLEMAKFTPHRRTLRLPPRSLPVRPYSQTRRGVAGPAGWISRPIPRVQLRLLLPTLDRVLTGLRQMFRALSIPPPCLLRRLLADPADNVIRKCCYFPELYLLGLTVLRRRRRIWCPCRALPARTMGRPTVNQGASRASALLESRKLPSLGFPTMSTRSWFILRTMFRPMLA